MALKYEPEAQRFTFLSEWAVFRLVLHLSVRPFGLLNVIFLVFNVKLAENDLLINQPVLKHLVINSKIMLQSKRVQLNDKEYSCLIIVSSPAV